MYILVRVLLHTIARVCVCMNDTVATSLWIYLKNTIYFVPMVTVQSLATLRIMQNDTRRQCCLSFSRFYIFQFALCIQCVCDRCFASLLTHSTEGGNKLDVNKLMDYVLVAKQFFISISEAFKKKRERGRN